MERDGHVLRAGVADLVAHDACCRDEGIARPKVLGKCLDCAFFEIDMSLERSRSIIEGSRVAGEGV